MIQFLQQLLDGNVADFSCHLVDMDVTQINNVTLDLEASAIYVATPPYSRPSTNSSFVRPIASMDIVQAMNFTPKSRATSMSSSRLAMPLSFIMDRSIFAPIPMKFMRDTPRDVDPDGVMRANIFSLMLF